MVLDSCGSGADAGFEAGDGVETGGAGIGRAGVDGDGPGEAGADEGGAGIGRAGVDGDGTGEAGADEAGAGAALTGVRTGPGGAGTGGEPTGGCSPGPAGSGPRTPTPEGPGPTPGVVRPTTEGSDGGATVRGAGARPRPGGLTGAAGVVAWPSPRSEPSDESDKETPAVWPARRPERA